VRSAAVILGHIYICTHSIRLASRCEVDSGDVVLGVNMSITEYTTSWAQMEVASAGQRVTSI